MASMYWLISWKKKGEQRVGSVFKLRCLSQRDCDRWVGLLKKDPNNETVTVEKLLILKEKPDYKD